MITNIMEAMLESQRMVQLGYGHNFGTKTPTDQMRYLGEMALALCDEVHEALGETGWKSWTSSNHINREEFMGEMADVFLFFMNMMLAAGMTSDDLIKRVAKKQDNSFKRQKKGYDGVSTKCPECKRAYDNEGVKCNPEGGCAYTGSVTLGVVSSNVDITVACAYCTAEYGKHGCHPATTQGFGWCGLNHRSFFPDGKIVSA